MKRRVAAFVLSLAGACAALANPTVPESKTPPTRAATMTHRATGAFDVKLFPLADDKGEGGSLGRMSLDKQFHGDLQATSKGEMLTSVTTTQGSAGYVAIERVTGELQGKAGTFVLQHSGVMKRGAPSLLITVVPDSGTGALKGIEGKMTIRIEAGGKHFYDLEYALQTP